MEEIEDGVKDDGKRVEGYDEEVEDDDDDDGDEEPRPPFVVKLIDFAHTIIVPGKEPDEGVLLGMDTILRLLDSRLSELVVVSRRSSHRTNLGRRTCQRNVVRHGYSTYVLPDYTFVQIYHNSQVMHCQHLQPVASL